ncbi:MAG TPA: carboxypeptidase-like regulatory domain-containing protein [Acidobacteriaceae bacterium]|nr:carboxypeptidase-like regulatory domain-containing protein [Acidobacteriaceae bacterium]
MTRTLRPLRTSACLVAALVLLAAAGVAPRARAQDFGVKQLQGKVLSSSEAALTGAIVYLENSRNNDIKSYITETDGAYHFANLSADTDYTVWAQFKGKKSSVKTISSFDSRRKVFLDLHIKN